MERAPQFSAGMSLQANCKPKRPSVIRGATVALTVAAAMSWSGAGHALVLAETTSQADPQQLCLGASSTVDEQVSGCSAMIESGKVQGRELAAAYATRGFALTIKRNLDQAQKDLDQAVKLAPDYALAYVNRANFWTVANQPQRAQARAECAASAFRARRRRSRARAIRPGDRRL